MTGSSSGPGYGDRGIPIIAIFWSESLTAILVLGLRFYGRLVSSKVGRDDWAMLIAMILFLAYSGFASFLANTLAFRHASDLSTEERISAVKYNFANQEWAIAGLVIGKVSIALQLLRILEPKNRLIRWTLYFLMGSLAVFSIADCVLIFAQCSPPSALWDSSVSHTCWDANIRIDYAIFLGGWNVLADFVLAVLPVGIIMKMNTNLEQRISTAILLGLGVAAAAFGIVKTTYLKTMNPNGDLTWDIFSLYVWTSLEYWMVIICGSIPPIRALILCLLAPKKKVTFADYDVANLRDQKRPLGLFRSLDGTIGQDNDTEGLRSTITAGEEQMRNCVSPVDRIVRMTDIRIESEPAEPAAVELHTL